MGSWSRRTYTPDRPVGRVGVRGEQSVCFGARGESLLLYQRCVDLGHTLRVSERHA